VYECVLRGEVGKGEAVFFFLKGCVSIETSIVCRGLCRSKHQSLPATLPWKPSRQPPKGAHRFHFTSLNHTNSHTTDDCWCGSKSGGKTRVHQASRASSKSRSKASNQGSLHRCPTFQRFPHASYSLPHWSSSQTSQLPSSRPTRRPTLV